MIPCAWEVVIPEEICPGWDAYPQTTKDIALWLASTWLWGATGRQYGVCPVTVQSGGRERGAPVAYRDFAAIPGTEALGLPGGPYLFSGRWFNSACGTVCCGADLCALVLDGPVAEIEEVTVSGEVIEPSAYRVDVSQGTYLLVRTDGECWPVCGGTEVVYGRGRALPEALAIATAMLACQYAKHLSGAACALPAKMTRLSRQGVEVTIDPPEPTEGLTGIKAVDEVVKTLNPSGRQRPPVALSPDMPGVCDRQTVWIGGS